jgi:hypothetical protein
MEMTMKSILSLLTALFLVTQAYAHGPDRGPNGGKQVDAGDYHVEMVAKDTQLAVYLRDDKDKPVDATGFKATGIFVVGGKPQRIELKTESANKLSGTSSVPLPATLKGAVQITSCRPCSPPPCLPRRQQFMASALRCRPPPTPATRITPLPRASRATPSSHSGRWRLS